MDTIWIGVRIVLYKIRRSAIQFHGNGLTHQGNRNDKSVKSVVLHWLVSSRPVFTLHPSYCSRTVHARIQWPLKFGIPQHGFCQHFNCHFIFYGCFQLLFCVDYRLLIVDSFFFVVCSWIYTYIFSSSNTHFTRNKRKKKKPTTFN